MDDLLTRHADNVGEANTEHAAVLKALRDEVDAALRNRIAAFGTTMLDLVKMAEAERLAFTADLDAFMRNLGEKASDAFGENIAAITLSATDFSRELDARAAFLRTGQLPIGDPLPKTEVAPPQGESAPAADLPAQDDVERAAA